MLLPRSAVGRSVETGCGLQQRALPRPRGTHHGGERSTPEGGVDAGQGGDLLTSAVIGPGELFHPNRDTRRERNSGHAPGAAG